MEVLRKFQSFSKCGLCIRVSQHSTKSTEPRFPLRGQPGANLQGLPWGRWTQFWGPGVGHTVHTCVSVRAPQDSRVTLSISGRGNVSATTTCQTPGSPPWAWGSHEGSITLIRELFWNSCSPWKEAHHTLSVLQLPSQPAGCWALESQTGSGPDVTDRTDSGFSWAWFPVLSLPLSPWATLDHSEPQPPVYSEGKRCEQKDAAKSSHLGDFPAGTVDESAYQCRVRGFDPWSGKIPYAVE